ncbi:hypothetical protein QBC44DRAFT_309980 [Cladorrhinum sp. PSN332]|nr:hypothetical protein QBC44DRAFT_309980 [Cladorrhinum sp. PSN332]
MGLLHWKPVTVRGAPVDGVINSGDGRAAGLAALLGLALSSWQWMMQLWRQPAVTCREQIKSIREGRNKRWKSRVFFYCGKNGLGISSAKQPHQFNLADVAPLLVLWFKRKAAQVQQEWHFIDIKGKHLQVVRTAGRRGWIWQVALMPLSLWLARSGGRFKPTYPFTPQDPDSLRATWHDFVVVGCSRPRNEYNLGVGRMAWHRLAADADTKQETQYFGGDGRRMSLRCPWCPWCPSCRRRSTRRCGFTIGTLPEPHSTQLLIAQLSTHSPLVDRSWEGTTFIRRHAWDATTRRQSSMQRAACTGG